MAVIDGAVFSHVGICVSDYEKSLRFYTEGLGFELAEGWPVGDVFAPLAEVSPPMKARTQISRKGATRLEIIGWTTPAAGGTPLQRRNQNGLTHLSFYVDDLAAVAGHLVSLGATLPEDTRVHIDVPGGAMDMVFLADPDGTRIELVQDTTKPFPPF
ncbi:MULTISPECIES: VOC family protein [Pseudofrankia]|uniref:VOC family protein n=1 Tax=Pseudofrankia TaxID=2994363 RepID=UPI000234BA1D|nr:MULTISPECIES: VOC family protein [Pseudofrankia]OHV41616.1 glyoxalase [Pseudofrankia sp. EUN1h]